MADAQAAEASTLPHTSLSRLQTFYCGLGAEALLRVMIKLEFSGRIATLSSFGADSALLLAMTAEVDPRTPVLFLETDRHFPETLEYVENLREKLGLEDLRYLRPDPALASRLDPNGDLWNVQPNRCCWMRKVEPLKRALKEGGFQALITGRKRYQTEERHEMGMMEVDEDGIVRLNPLAEWTKEDIRREMVRRGLPDHPLVAKGYPSIGCAPCTRPVKPGEDERQGRWAHTREILGVQKAECGIHVPTAAEAPSWDV